jgi:hypothetical protein
MLTNVFDPKGLLIVNSQTFSSRTGKTSGLPKDMNYSDSSSETPGFLGHGRRGK